jgi:hypothetical protein
MQSPYREKRCRWMGVNHFFRIFPRLASSRRRSRVRAGPDTGLATTRWTAFIPRHEHSSPVSAWRPRLCARLHVPLSRVLFLDRELEEHAATAGRRRPRRRRYRCRLRAEPIPFRPMARSPGARDPTALSRARGFAMMAREVRVFQIVKRRGEHPGVSSRRPPALRRGRTPAK